MNQVLYKNRCKCKESTFVTRKPTSNIISEGKPAQYPEFKDAKLKTFHVVYDQALCLETKRMLYSFQKKYFYYVVDDILYGLSLPSKVRKNLFELVCTPVLALHNRDSVGFFDIWIHEIYIDKQLKTNKFLTDKYQPAYQVTFKILYTIKKPTITKRFLW